MAATAVGNGKGALDRAIGIVTPRILYGLRMLASVALAMWVAFWLQLDNAFWAPLTAAIVCQPSIGASLRKGQFRIIGTSIGAIAIVLLTSTMPQGRIALFAGLFAWAGLAGFAATLLRNSTAYAASLAGYTAVIVFSDAVSTTPNDVFMLAVTRATEISIGVLSAGLVLAATDFGHARRQLGNTIAEVIGASVGGLLDTLSMRVDTPTLRDRRRDLIGRVIALDPLTDEVLGESAELRSRSRTLQSGLEGLLGALASWRGIEAQFDVMSADRARIEGADLLPALASIAELDWCDAPSDARRRCIDTAKQILRVPTRTASARLISDRVAEALLGLARGANGLALLRTPRQALPDRGKFHFYVPDLLPAVLNGLRVVVAMAVASIIWVETAWPGGQSLVTFSAVVTILFAPQAERAFSVSLQFAFGVFTATVLAAIVKFAVLPQQQSFLALVVVIGVVMIPAAAFAAGASHKFYFSAITFIFLALLAPSNEATFDLSSYLNGALGIVGGVVIAICFFRLIPPLSSQRRAGRLLGLTLRDLRRLAVGRRRYTRRWWVGHVTARFAIMQDAIPLDRARMLSGFSAGYAVIWLQQAADGLAAQDTLAAAMADISTGQVVSARDELARFAAAQNDKPRSLRAKAEAMLLSEALARHADYFADEALQAPT